MKINSKIKKYLIIILIILGLVVVRQIFIVLTQPYIEKQSIKWQPELVSVDALLPEELKAFNLNKNLIDFYNQKYIFVVVWKNQPELVVHLILIGPDKKGLAVLKSNFDLNERLTSDYGLNLTQTPEFLETKDINGDGLKEIFLNLGVGGAYTNDIGILNLKDEKIDWIWLETSDGNKMPAIFSQGSSVRNALIFQVVPEKYQLVQYLGKSEDGLNWQWQAEAYVLSGEVFQYDPALSEELSQKGPPAESQTF